MKRLSLCLAGLCLLAACNGGGGSDPTSPRPPANVAGSWTGSSRVLTATPGGNCIASFYAALAVTQFQENVSATVAQNGAAVDLTVAGLLTPTCTLRGTVSDTTLNATAQSCTDTGGSFTCGTLQAGIRSGTSTLTAAVSNGRLTGTQEFTLETFNIATGAALGAATVRRSFELQR